MRRPHDDCIERAVAFLRRRQLPHGEFAMMLGADRGLSAPVLDSTPFGTAVVTYALAQLQLTGVADMIARAAAYLRAEMELGGVWRYHAQGNFKHARLPPDLDDTACASYALRVAGSPVPANAWLFLANRDLSGRFRTWILPTRRNRWNLRFAVARSLGSVQARLRARRVPAPESEDTRFRVMRINRDDVDPVVNANVVLYLGERSATRPAIDLVVRAVLADAAPFSLYYEDPLALYHAAARAYRHAAPSLGVLREPILDRIARRALRPDPLTPLQAALAASALLTFDPDAPLGHELVRMVCSTQREDGGWDAYAYYNVWGSEELTTAFCLEALARSRAAH
ncbi:MAG: terpene cyclase/mutase family protein [Candidatus Eremiobacteraeota bacterium]|nr:terpene cyclase/mutase family protein [Candidatus Eremiobacteraeota bacterium]